VSRRLITTFGLQRLRRKTMARFMLLLPAIFALTGASNARGEDTEEVKRLKEKVELLQAKLEAANLKIEKLQKENDQLRAGGAKGAATRPAGDVFAVGTKLVGTVQRSWAANGKQVVMGDDVEMEVTKRSGAEFTAEYWADSRKVGAEVEGTIDSNGVVKFKSTKSLTDAKVNLVGVHTFVGRIDNGVLTGKTTKKGEPSYKGEWKLKVKKE
jgi:hypothetical protein